MINNEIKQVSYWNEYARWYKLWREHNSYHEPIKNFLFSVIHKDIRVLDIGAGDGVLSFPLIERGCNVTALEPSSTMCDYMLSEAFYKRFVLDIDSRRFEELDIFELKRYDLALACNSLHLTEEGIEAAMDKIFSSEIDSVFLVTEKSFSLKNIFSKFPAYKLIFNYSYYCESSFAYHNKEEIFQHWQFKTNRKISEWNSEKILRSLIYEKGHFWLKDYANVNIFYWRRKKSDFKAFNSKKINNFDKILI